MCPPKKVFRHGQRTPTDSYPLDPHINETYFPFGRGNLTNKGKFEMLSLGQSLETNYESFLRESAIRMQAVDTCRTKLSALLCLKGLNVHLRNISYAVTDRMHDRLMGPIYKICPTYNEMYENYLNTPGVVPETYRDFLQFLSKETGLPVNGISEASDILDIILTQLDLGLKPPIWCNSSVINLMNEINNFAFHSFAATPELKQLVGGPLLKKILDDSISNRKKMFLYSGHGETVSELMSAMNLKIDRPPYGSQIIIEILNLRDTRYIRVLYRDNLNGRPKLLKIAGCQNPCTLRQFRSLIQENLPNNDTCYN